MTITRAISHKRLTQLLLVLAALVLGLAASATFAMPADAQVVLLPRKFTVMVTFDSIEFPKLDDCPGGPLGAFCNSADLYGMLQAKSNSGSGTRVIGTWANTAGCFNFWDQVLSEKIGCVKMIRDGTQGPSFGIFQGPFNFAETGLCTSTAFLECDGPHTLNNNNIFITMRSGETLNVAATMMDDDTFTSDDVVCDVSVPLGPFSGAQLSTLNLPGLTMAQGFNGDGSCTVKFSVKRVA